MKFAFSKSLPKILHLGNIGVHPASISFMCWITYSRVCRRMTGSHCFLRMSLRFRVKIHQNLTKVRRGLFWYFWVFYGEVDFGLIKVRTEKEECDGWIMGGDSGEVISGSKSNIPSRVSSETCPSETLLAWDVLGVVKFGLFGWEA